VKHIDSWYQYAWRLGYREMQAPEGSIMLIKGCDKTSSWAHATFAERTREASVVFDGGYMNVGGAVRLQGSWSRAVSTIYREAPLSGRQVQATTISLSGSSRDSDSSQATARNNNPADNSAVFPTECVYSIFARVYRIRRRSVLGMVKMVTVEVDGRASRHLQPRSPPVSEHSLLYFLRKAYRSIRPADHELMTLRPSVPQRLKFLIPPLTRHCRR
jgi:hypothetical protein